MKSKTTIEVNGKRYDAITGAVVGPAIAPHVKSGRNIDGFFRSRTAPTPKATLQVSKTVAAAAAPSPKRRPHKLALRTPNHAVAHAVQTSTVAAMRRQTSTPRSAAKPQTHRSDIAPNHAKAHPVQNAKTLMRTAVKRPAPGFHVQAKPVAALQHAVPSLIVTKASVHSLDHSRLTRAQDIPRSPRISRHSSPAPNIFATVAPLAVQPAPPAKPGDEDPTAPSPAPTNKPIDIFEHALMNASHFVDIHARRTHFRKQVSKHMISMASGALALAVIVGFAVYQNTPGIQFKVASIRAGVSTNMPKFENAGFAYNGSRAENGKLTIGFTSSQGDYQLVQRTTNLTGSEVIQNIGSTTAGGQPTYQAIQTDDTTVYRFSNTDATWVADGKWYTVNGTGSLSDDQVASLVRNT